MALPSASGVFVEEVIDGGLLGLSGFLSGFLSVSAAGWFEVGLVGRGGGGRLGGGCLAEPFLAGGLSLITTASSFTSFKVGDLEGGFAPGSADGGTKLLILFGGGGRGPLGDPCGVSPSETVLMPR